MAGGSTVRGILVVAAILLAPASSRAEAPIGPNARFVTVFSESVDGKTVLKSTVESEVAKALLNHKITLVDVEQSRAIRAQIADPKTPVAALPKDIAAFDADIIVQGSATLRRVRSKVLPKSVHRYDARIEAKIVRVDSASILASLTIDRGSVGVSEQLALSNAAQKASAALAVEIAKLVGSGGMSEVDLFVFGIPDVGAGKELRGTIQSLPRVKSLQVQTESPEQSRYLIRSSYDDAQTLAEALQEQAAGLSIVAHSRTVVKANYQAAAAIRITPSTIKFGHRGAAQSRWLQQTLPNLVALELAQDERVETGAQPTHELRGRLQVKRKSVVVSARLVEAKGQRIIARVNQTCPTLEANSCARSVGRALRDRLGQADHRGKKKPGLGPTRPIRMNIDSLPPAFPAVLATTPGTTIGTVRLTNDSSAAIKNVILRARIPSLSQRSIISPVPEIGGGETVDVGIRIDLAEQGLRGLTQHRAAVVALSLEYPAEGLTVRDAQDHPLLLYALTAIDWSDPESVGAFVQPSAPAVGRLAKAARAAVPTIGNATAPLTSAAAIHETLRSLDLRYRIDATRPLSKETLDDVSFPDQTLGERGGDCDDLSVLAAALGEALDSRIVLLGTPHHLMYAVATGLPPQARHLVPAAPGELLTHDGELFIPIDATRSNESFQSAWREGARTWRKWDDRDDQRVVIDLRKAWSARSPLPFTPNQQAVSLPQLSRVGERVAAALESARARQKRLAKAAISSFEARMRKTNDPKRQTNLALEKAERLVLGGRLAEAQEILRNLSATSSPHSGRLQLLLGNIDMLGGSPADALVHFRAGIEAKEETTHGLLHINAALAALASGDRGAFDDHVLSALELGRVQEVASLARAGKRTSTSQGKAAGPGQVRLEHYLVWSESAR